MEWLLIVLIFSGPTSADRIKVERWSTNAECEERAKKTYRWDEYVCFPVNKLEIK